MYNEQKYVSRNGIKLQYMLEEHCGKGSDKLIVVFSAFSPKGNPEYNYVRTLKNIKVNKLFILDNYGPKGCYYLGCDNNYNVADAVCELIEAVSSNYGISKEKTTFVGSSKGGFAALYFGLKLNVGNVIAGEPQIEVANYLLYVKGTDVLQYIIGGVLKRKQSLRN